MAAKRQHVLCGHCRPKDWSLLQKLFISLQDFAHSDVKMPCMPVQNLPGTAHTMLYVCLQDTSRLHPNVLLLRDILGFPCHPTPPSTRRSWSLLMAQFLVAQRTYGHCLKYLVSCVQLPVATSYDCAVQISSFLAKLHTTSSVLDDFQ